MLGAWGAAFGARGRVGLGLERGRYTGGLRCRQVCGNILAMTPRDLERLRFVTRRFTSLHGLRWFVLGPAILSAFWLQPYLKALRHSGQVGLLLGLLGTLAPFVFVLVGIPLIERYYRQRFGSVRGAVRTKWPSLPDALIFLGVAAFELTKFERSGSSLLLAAGCVTCLHVTVRDWPWRGYYICPAIVCAAGLWVMESFPPIRVDSIPNERALAFTFALLPLLVAAALDQSARPHPAAQSGGGARADSGCDQCQHPLIISPRSTDWSTSRRVSQS